jgi:effector-binding domain-containing protein
MLTLPELIDRPARPYAFVPFTVTMAELVKVADEGFPKLFAALAERGMTPIGAPFFNYRRIDMAHTLDVQAGVVVAETAEDGADLGFSTLPAGRYVTLEWHGHYDKLEAVTAVLIGWTRLVGMNFDMHESADGDHFASRLELYETDPSAESDPEKWLTRLEFKLAPDRL